MRNNRISKSGKTFFIFLGILFVFAAVAVFLTSAELRAADKPAKAEKAEKMEKMEKMAKSSTEESKAFVRRFIEEAINKGDVAGVDKFFAASYIDHHPFPGQKPGLEGFKEGISMYFKAFPDLHFEIEDLLAEGDKIVVRGTSHATHKGEFMGMAATGKKISVQEIHIVRVAGGKIVEHWGLEDDMTMMQQLGMMSPPGQTKK